jgi:hypothetical protein
LSRAHRDQSISKAALALRERQSRTGGHLYNSFGCAGAAILKRDQGAACAARCGVHAPGWLVRRQLRQLGAAESQSHLHIGDVGDLLHRYDDVTRQDAIANNQCMKPAMTGTQQRLMQAAALPIGGQHWDAGRKYLSWFIDHHESPLESISTHLS